MVTALILLIALVLLWWGLIVGVSIGAGLYDALTHITRRDLLTVTLTAAAGLATYLGSGMVSWAILAGFITFAGLLLAHEWRKRHGP